MTLAFSVPGEVKGQGRPRATIRCGHAAVYERAEDKSYKGLIQFHAMKAMENKGLSSPICPDDIGFQVSLIAVKAIPKSFTKKNSKKAFEGLMAPQTKPDLDNIAKSYLDALNGIVWKDDSAVTSLSVSKVYGESNLVSVIIGYNEPMP